MINENLIINSTITLLDALSIMDSIDRKLLIVCDGDIFKGVISIGDIQRALLNKQDMNLPVSDFFRKKITFARDDEDIDSIKDKMRIERIESMPIVNDELKLVDVIEWKQLFKTAYTSDALKEYTVVIMAGGKGTRLLPLTNVIPKPLIPVSNKTIIEEIMDSFINAGCNDFYISVNYKTDAIKDYLKEKYAVKYVQEDKPLGTGGSLYLLRGLIESTFIVSNCDTIADVNYEDLVNYHKDNNNAITVVSVVKKISIPYGIIETEEKGVLTAIKEKPELVYQINSGIYVLEPDVLKFISDNEFMNITDLIRIVVDNKLKVGVFPISDGSWTDMGNWDEYLKVVNRYLDKKDKIDE